jgi:hypothetical protein
MSSSQDDRCGHALGCGKTRRIFIIGAPVNARSALPVTTLRLKSFMHGLIYNRPDVG